VTDLPLDDMRSGAPTVAKFAADVRQSLMLDPRQLPSRYLYDALGSALFEAICHLPWYAITRAETALLAAHAAAIFARLPDLCTIVELGPGNGHKLATLLDAGWHGQGEVEIHLIDISASALFEASHAIGLREGLRIVTHEAAYEAGLADVARGRRRGGRTLTLFLGSNIGNFDPPGAALFLRGIRGAMTAGDALLVGADLVKPEAALIAAYDDPLGVTAAFNRNLIVRINRELGGDFDLDAFAHRAVWNADRMRVEMHLVSLKNQCVSIEAAALKVPMRQGETIWTESSYKHHPEILVEMLADAGFRCVDQWIAEPGRFALTLVEAV
jgi:L-histidine N-alpha-methyltransferase